MVGCSPAWPNPGGAQSGYLVEGEGRLLLDCGPGVLSRLREVDGGWPRVDCDRDHALPPRPLGRHRAVGVGPDVRPRPRPRAARAVAAPRRRGAGRGDRRAARLPRDVRRDLRAADLRGGHAVRGGRVPRHRAARPALPDGGVRLPGRGRGALARLLRRHRPGPRARRGGEGRRPLPLRGDDRAVEPGPRRPARPPERGRGGAPPSRPPAPRGCCSRTGPRSSRSIRGFELVHDGYTTDV